MNDKVQDHASLWEIGLTKALDLPGGEVVYMSEWEVSDEVEITAVVDAADAVNESSEDNNKKIEVLSCRK